MVITIPAWAILTVSMCGGGFVINRVFKSVKKLWNDRQDKKDRKFLGKWYELFLYIKQTRDYGDRKRAIGRFLSHLYATDNSFNLKPMSQIPSSYKMSYKQRDYILALLNPKDREQAKNELNKFLLTPEIEYMVKEFLRTN